MPTGLGFAAPSLVVMPTGMAFAAPSLVVMPTDMAFQAPSLVVMPTGFIDDNAQLRKIIRCLKFLLIDVR